MAKLTIQDISKILIEKCGLSQKQAKKFASDMFALIIEKLQEGEQIKVRGLGTFKVISVEPRESVNVRTGERILIEGHDKVTFTPDSLIKELVNKPFSQFETVVLNDGVVFDDEQDEIKDDELSDEDEENLPLEERPLVAYIDEEKEELQNEDMSIAPEENLEITEISEKTTDNNVQAEEQKDIQEQHEELEPQERQESLMQDEYVDDDDENHTPWIKWILGTVGVIALMLASAYGGYYYAMKEMQPVKELMYTTLLEKEKKVAEEKVDTPIAIKDSMRVSEPMEASKPLESAKHVEAVAPVKGVKPVEMVKSAAHTSQKNAEEQAKPKAVEPLDSYAAKDERVRLGAYKIVGTLNVITVQPGQTFYSICKGNLGPDMECYVEVYNDFPRKPQIKVGQKIKIPKLELKKKRKR